MGKVQPQDGRAVTALLSQRNPRGRPRRGCLGPPRFCAGRRCQSSSSLPGSSQVRVRAIHRHGCSRRLARAESTLMKIMVDQTTPASTAREGCG